MNKIYLNMMILIFLTSCATVKKEADLIIFNGQIYTVDDEFSIATAFAVKDGKILDIGAQEDILSQYAADQVIDADGKAVYPGFIDGHCHFYGLAEKLYRYADLTGSRSFDEVIQRVRDHLEAHPTDFVLGRGWDQNLWEPPVFPDNELLEQYFPEKKILLIRIDGHASIASKAALQAAGINAHTRIDGGEVIVNKNGQPTGVLIDRADTPIRELITPLNNTEKQTALIEAQKQCFSVGLTSVTDAGLTYETIELIRSMQQEGQLLIRINAMLDHDEKTLDYYLPKGVERGERLSINAIKLYADGALGSRGAKLLEPYADVPDKSGFMLFDDDFYRNIAQRAYDAGFQVNTHAIGDAAVRYVLDLYAHILQGKNDRRWRIEHAQIVHSDDFHKFGEYSIIPSIQSTHATSDMHWAVNRIGLKRLQGAYAQLQLLKENGWLVNGTDFPIEDINPMNTFYAAVVRKDANGLPADGFQIENAISREQALRSMTIWAAKGSFEEQYKGSLETGKYADFVIMEKDIMTCDPDQIRDNKVVMLYSNGERVYQQE
ncbi:MAG: amidohydrolase [Bacteroidales bacterium]|nr:amidohydrolase [Bacteroidales bacterium]